LGDYFSPELKEKLAICSTERKSVAYESLCTDKKGKKYWFQTNLTPITNVDDEVEKIIAIDSDISELKEAKIEIESQRDELTKLNATKDKFFSIIAHDLKNPFHAIIGFTDLLSQNFKKIKDSEKLELIDLINTTTKSTYNLLENLLHWARTQTNAIKFKPAKISITDLINENVRFLQLNANKKNIDLKSDVKKDLMVFADSNMINTVLRNLLNNALKFTDHGGKVTINAKELNRHVEISVSDTGIGMDQNTLDNLFKIEEYKTTQGTSGETGTGLGLIICNEFVKKNGGKLYVESEKGKYTTFFFSLPKV
jgi:signal transduction histidine kinase